MKTLLSSRRFAPPMKACAVFAGLTLFAMTVNAKTVNVTDPNTKLSAAVLDAYSDGGATPAIVNLQVDNLVLDDGQVVIDKPIIINGDAEDTDTNGSPDGNGTQCDILVDMSAIIDLTFNNINEQNAYIEITAPGDVSISDIRIHPDEDGEFKQSGAERELDLISGIRLFRPPLETDVGNYVLTNVYVSGSDENNLYLDLDTGADLFPTAKRWGGHNGKNAQGDPLTNTQADGQYADDAAIQIGNGPGDGRFNSILDHCHAGLSRSAACNINVSTGTHTILGGVYGHCARDGIRVDGTSITIQGTFTDRVRVVRPVNIGSDNSHGIEVAAGGDLLLLEYVDSATLNTGNSFNFRNGNVNLMQFCRGLGKIDGAGSNQTVFIQSPIEIGEIRNCTFDSYGGFASPFNVTADLVDPFEITNCIFTSVAGGTVNINTDPALVPITFTNCALPTDGLTDESLADPPVGPQPVNGAIFATPPVTASPMYQERIADYDWSNAQGGDGNANVLRPGNSSAYAMAGEGSTPLVGGAGGTAVPVTLSGFSIE